MRADPQKTARLARPPAESGKYCKEFRGIRDYTAQNVQAALKSADILSRGLRVLGFNVCGATNMTVDDGVAATRALMDCRTLPDWIKLQSELVKLNIGRATIRALVLSVMTVQVTEEAWFPLLSRANATYGVLDGTLVA